MSVVGVYGYLWAFMSIMGIYGFRGVYGRL